MQNQATRVLLEQARHHFQGCEYGLAKEKLQQINEHDLSTTLNIHLSQLVTVHRQHSNQVLRKLLNLLTSTNIQLYQKNRPKKINFISHELLYWNIIALAQNAGQTEVAELIGNQALFFYKSFKPSTSLKIISEMLKIYCNEKRLSSCFALLEKFEKVIDRNRKLNHQDIKLKAIINIIFTKVLINMHMINEGQGNFMIKFGQTEKEAFIEDEKSEKRKEQFLTYEEIINLLHAEIEFMSRNYDKCLHILSYNIYDKPSLEKACAQNNIALVLSMNGKQAAAQKLMLSSVNGLYKLMTQNKKQNNQILKLYNQAKQNMVIAHLLSREAKDTCTHSSLDYDQKFYTQMKAISEMHSYKQYYRRGESCLNLYHSLLEKVNRKLPYQEIHDNYDTVYYIPNQPYHQFKGKNKNAYQASKKQVHRRFAMNEWNNNPDEETIDKDINRKKFQKQVYALKLKEMLDQALHYFKKSLLVLEKEKKIIFHLEGIEKQTAQNIRQRLFHEHARFQCSLLCLLTYVSLCRCDWTSVVRYANQFESEKCFECSAEDHYHVLTYKMEAYCELNRPENAYSVIHEISSNGLSRIPNMVCRDGSNLNNCVMERQQSQEINFFFNLAVLHSRDNRIAQSYTAIQKLFAELNQIPNNPRVKIPLPMIQLLIHYNLRINNVSSALQLIKRRRILTGSNANISKQVLNVTK